MPQTQAKRLLVVDDEEDITTNLSNILKRANYEVTVTNKGKEVLGLIKNFSPDLIILDVLLPDIGGDEIAGTLLENPSTAKIPIIFLSGAIITKKEEPLAKKTGRHYLLAKPVTAKELLDTVKAALEDS